MRRLSNGICATVHGSNIKPRIDSLRHAIFTVARHKFAWPGGYLMVLVMSDGEFLCPDCVRENVDTIARDTRNRSRSGWAAAGADCLDNMDCEGERCVHCERELGSL